MGKRKQRLLGVKEREEQAEQRRIDIDAQWHAVRDQEKKDALEKSRMQRLYQNPEVRKLHSDLLTQNVVAERDLQLEFLRKKTQQQREIELSFARQTVKKIIDGAKGEKAKGFIQKEKMDEVTMYQRGQIEANAIKRERIERV